GDQRVVGMGQAMGIGEDSRDVVQRHLADLSAVLGNDQKAAVDCEVTTIRLDLNDAAYHSSLSAKRADRFVCLHTPQSPQFVDPDTFGVPFPQSVEICKIPAEGVVLVVVPGLENPGLVMLDKVQTVVGWRQPDDLDDLVPAFVIDPQHISLEYAHHEASACFHLPSRLC